MAADQDPDILQSWVVDGTMMSQGCIMLSAPGQILRACRDCFGMLPLAYQLLRALEPPVRFEVYSC